MWRSNLEKEQAACPVYAEIYCSSGVSSGHGQGSHIEKYATVITKITLQPGYSLNILFFLVPYCSSSLVTLTVVGICLSLCFVA